MPANLASCGPLQLTEVNHVRLGTCGAALLQDDVFSLNEYSG
jgi:hypothetical protein